MIANTPNTNKPRILSIISILRIGSLWVSKLDKVLVDCLIVFTSELAHLRHRETLILAQNLGKINPTLLCKIKQLLYLLIGDTTSWCRLLCLLLWSVITLLLCLLTILLLWPLLVLLTWRLLLSLLVLRILLLWISCPLIVL